MRKLLAFLAVWLAAHNAFGQAVYMPEPGGNKGAIQYRKDDGDFGGFGEYNATTNTTTIQGTLAVSGTGINEFGESNFTGPVNIDGNITAHYFLGNGSLLTGVSGGGSVNDTAYGVEWDGVTDQSPSMNSVYDVVSGLGGGHDAATVENTTDIDMAIDGQKINATINATLKANWDAAYGWGNHSLAGYLKDFTGLTTDNLTEGVTNKYANTTKEDHGEEAYLWGNHSQAGYLTTESDPGVSTHEGTYNHTAYKQFFRSFMITNATATADRPIWRVPFNATITAIHGILSSGTSLLGMLTECDANGANCVVCDSSDMNITTTVTNDDGSLSNPLIDAGDFIGWNTTSVSGENVTATISFEGVFE